MMGGSANTDIRMTGPPTLQRRLYQVAQMRTAADLLPSLFYVVVSNGKMAFPIFAAVYLIFVSLWFPFWLLSFLTTEWGVYALAVGTVFFAGRCIIRLIAFPGASQKVTGEIEAEFARYSVRMVTSAADSFAEVAAALTSNDKTAGSSGSSYQLPGLWKRAKSFRDRVLGVYLEVLLYIFQQPSESSVNHASSDLTKYGSNRLSGDIGNLSGLTPQAKVDGRELMERLQVMLRQVDQLEQHAGGILTGDRSFELSDEARATAAALLSTSRELRDFVSSLKPPPGSNNEEPEDEGDEDLTVDAVRRKFEEQGSSAAETFKNGLASILPMLDPPPHTSVFGFDVQRGCMLSRYRGARQVWVRRPSGGMIDVYHFPARNKGSTLPRNHKAVLYCNPNAGLIEVATGMSLVGGNVPTGDGDNSSHDNSWTDFYTDLGFDVYIFNYAGYGRSFGTTLCVSGRNTGDNYKPGLLARLGRVFRSSFLTFQPTPDTLRADGIAVAQHLLNDGVDQLVIHGESIGGVAASGTARSLSESPATRNKLALLLVDRTFCNLEAVAQRLIGGWTGFAIRGLAPFWNTDVAGDFIAATCPKVVANDAADAIINDPSSLKSGIALWKEMHRGVATTKGIGWIAEAPLQYRMADFENVCVTDSKYVASTSLLRPKAPVWPNDRYVSLEEAFHFAACCKRIGKIATQMNRRTDKDVENGVEMDNNGVLHSQQPMLIEAWRVLACCDGLTGAPLGVNVKRGFDSTVTWLCSCLVFGGQSIIAVSEERSRNEGRPLNSGPLEITPADFDSRPQGYQRQEREGMTHPRPIPEVIEKLAFCLESGDQGIAVVSPELQFIVGTLLYVQARLSAGPMVEAAQKSLHLQVSDAGIGSFFNLHCGHNNPFSKGERERLKALLEQATGGGAAPGL